MLPAETVLELQQASQLESVGPFIYRFSTPLKLSEADTVNPVLTHFPVVVVDAPLIVGAVVSTRKLEVALVDLPTPDLALVAHAPLPKKNPTLYTPSDNPVKVNVLPPDPTSVPGEFVT